MIETKTKTKKPSSEGKEIEMKIMINGKEYMTGPQGTFEIGDTACVRCHKIQRGGIHDCIIPGEQTYSSAYAEEMRKLFAWENSRFFESGY